MISHESNIIIVGSGVFGLSTALWLARSGYKNVTAFDRCAFDKKHYNPFDGCDGASSDINKIYRATYGSKVEYQALALEARDIWLEWTKTIRQISPSELPPGVSPEDRLIDFCGCYYLAEGPDMQASFADSLESTKKHAPQSRELQFIKGKAEDEKRLATIDPKWVEKYHVLDRINDGNTNGFLDIGAGINLADKACTYAQFLCEQAGVKFVLGQPQGQIERLIIQDSSPSKRVTGIKTCDGLSHYGDLVIVAAGPWTASVIPEARRTCEATAGTVMFIDVPKDRKDLWKKFHPNNFPVWTYRRGIGDTYYQGGGFPITSEGRIKFGYLGRKFTNFQDHSTEPNLRISTPRTKHTPDSTNTVPLHGLKLMKKVIAQAFPELVDLGFSESKLCWYTDTVGEDDMVIDYVPGYSDSLFVCTGHGFKFLPNLGKYVKNQLERVPSQFTRLWQWRTVEEGQVSNGIGEGEDGPREMSKAQMADPAKDFKFHLNSHSKP